MKRYHAIVEPMGAELPEAKEYRAVLDLENGSIFTSSDDPFGAMCKMHATLRDLGARGHLEGTYNGEPIFDPFKGKGLKIHR
jgi:hypothetical protein